MISDNAKGEKDCLYLTGQLVIGTRQRQGCPAHPFQLARLVSQLDWWGRELPDQQAGPPAWLPHREKSRVDFVPAIPRKGEGLSLSWE